MADKKIVVERRGPFEDDAFFRDCRVEWERAMSDAVLRWEKLTGHPSQRELMTTIPETRSLYRKIRTSNVSFDDSQAVSCTEEQSKYKMVMDVKDFSPDNISIKAIDDTIVVEGKYEKKEGNTRSLQTFVRRFLLPPSVNMNSVTSALSRDGVLTINAPKMPQLTSIGGDGKPSGLLRGDNTITSKVMGSNYYSGRPTFIQVTGGPPAGKPSSRDSEPFNPTGGSNVTVYETNRGTARITKTTSPAFPEERGREHFILTKGDGSDRWRTFNTMVKESQKEMEQMMKNHTISSTETSSKATSSLVPTAPVGAVTRDVTRDGNTVTERKEQRWNDEPAPGMVRSNRALSENSETKGPTGQVMGNKMKQELESKAEGSREETLPDGTKCKIFTKTYETKNSYKATSKAV